jgi:hypothetical protein
MANKSVTACECGSWHLAIWDKNNPDASKIHVPWSCRSWRHKGECQRWKGGQDFARVAYAISRFADWTYLVLTFAHNDWINPFDQYVAGKNMWSMLRKRITRRYGPFKYIQTWERNKGGGAHVNVVISNRNLYSACSFSYANLLYTFLEPAAVACGFGCKTWVECMYGDDSMAGYLTKLSRELVGAQHKDQVPYDAPPHFRRIRASQKTLPPPHKSELTGELLHCRLDGWEMYSETQRVECFKELRKAVMV